MKTPVKIADAHADRPRPLAQDGVIFTSTCPKCQQQVQQDGYSRVVLFSFLDMVHPIDAYCAACDELWAINAEERHAIAESLAA
jgi:hypothetical protein